MQKRQKIYISEKRSGEETSLRETVGEAYNRLGLLELRAIVVYIK